MYVTFSGYTKKFGGSLIPEADFSPAEREAEAYIRSLTYLNGDIFADKAHAAAIKAAVCAGAEAYYSATLEQENGGNVKSESKDGLSVSFAISRKDGETVDKYVKRCMYQAIRKWLLPTGWLSRRAGCGNVY